MQTRILDFHDFVANVKNFLGVPSWMQKSSSPSAGGRYWNLRRKFEKLTRWRSSSWRNLSSRIAATQTTSTQPTTLISTVTSLQPSPSRSWRQIITWLVTCSLRLWLRSIRDKGTFGSSSKLWKTLWSNLFSRPKVTNVSTRLLYPCWDVSYKTESH